MNTELPAFLRRAASERFRFGEWDCAMTIANWVWLVTGTDPAPELRGTYRTEAGWRSIVEKKGGLAALVGTLAEGAGLAPTDDPLPGDIGIVDVPTYGHTAAIRVRRGWAMKMIDGLTTVNVDHVAAWRVA